MSFVQTTRIETNRVDLYTETTDAITSNNAMSIYLQLWNESLNSLKIPKWYPETVNRRRTDDTATKRKKTKWQAMIYKTLNTKLKIEQKNRGELRYTGKVNNTLNI